MENTTLYKKEEENEVGKSNKDRKRKWRKKIGQYNIKLSI